MRPKVYWMRPEDDWVRLPQGDSRTTRRQVTKERNFFFSIFRNYTCTCVCFFKFVFSKHTHTIIFYFESVRTGAHKYRLRRNSTYKEQNEQVFFLCSVGTLPTRNKNEQLFFPFSQLPRVRLSEQVSSLAVEIIM